MTEQGGGAVAGRSQAHRRPTLRMVAELAGVSTATVSYVFSGRGGGASGVAEETARRVQRAADELNYRPNRAARAIRTGRSETVQLSLHVLSDPWALAVADAVNVEANRHGLTTLILADGDWHKALDRVECDVAYLDSVSDTDEDRRKLAELVGRGQRLVILSETLEPDGYDVIRSPAIPGCRIAVEHLLTRHTEVGCIAADDAVINAATEVTRYTPYLEGMRSHGLEVDPALTSTYSASSQASAFAAAVDLLTRERRPTAVFATTNFAGIATINAAHMLGLKVPHDVAVIGAGNTPDAHLISPTLTSVGPIGFFERQAEIIVANALSADRSSAVHEFPWGLIPGQSTEVRRA